MLDEDSSTSIRGSQRGKRRRGPRPRSSRRSRVRFGEDEIVNAAAEIGAHRPLAVGRVRGSARSPVRSRARRSTSSKRPSVDLEGKRPAGADELVGHAALLLPDQDRGRTRGRACRRPAHMSPVTRRRGQISADPDRLAPARDPTDLARRALRTAPIDDAGMGRSCLARRARDGCGLSGRSDRRHRSRLIGARTRDGPPARSGGRAPVLGACPRDPVACNGAAGVPTPTLLVHLHVAPLRTRSPSAWTVIFAALSLISESALISIFAAGDDELLLLAVRVRSRPHPRRRRRAI